MTGTTTSVSSDDVITPPMGQAVIGGVITSSLLTLVVVPVIYCYLDDLAGWAKRRWRGRSAPPAQAEPRLTPSATK